VYEVKRVFEYSLGAADERLFVRVEVERRSAAGRVLETQESIQEAIQKCRSFPDKLLFISGLISILSIHA
jgi:hypothetical protein